MYPERTLITWHKDLYLQEGTPLASQKFPQGNGVDILGNKA